jgi:hypothetical protein
MRSRIWSVLLLGAALVGTAACATSGEWGEWRNHSSHFASWHHLGFSVGNREGGAPRVARRDIEASRAESWWGKVITVSPEQIFQE